MPTGDFWQSPLGKKPYGELDPQDVIDVPVDWTEFCTEMSVTIASHTLTPDAPLEIVQSSQIDADTKILYRVKADELVYDSDVHLGNKYGVTCNVVFSDGQRKDKTLWYKFVEH